MKYGVQLYSLREMAEREGAEKVFASVAEAGYDGVEFAGFYDKTPQEILEYLNKYHLEGVSAHIRPEWVEANLPYIDLLGIKNVFIPAASAQELSTPELYAKFLEDTKKAKALLDQRGINFGYHNHWHEFADGKDYLTQVLNDVPGLTAELDVCWATVAGLNPAEKMKELGNRLAFLHIKEVPEGDVFKLPQPIVGEGIIDMPAVFDEANALGLEWAVLEVETFPCTEAEYLARSCQNMRKLGK